MRRCFDRAHPLSQPSYQPLPQPQVKHVGEHKKVARGSARNVLLVIVDDLRPDLGVYGRSWAHTPHLDKLGAQGTVFSSAHGPARRDRKLLPVSCSRAHGAAARLEWRG